jgi:hypothetical protein
MKTLREFGEHQASLEKRTEGSAVEPQLAADTITDKAAAKTAVATMRRAEDAVADAATQQLASIIQGHGLFDEEMAGLVINAPCDAWRAMFNNAKGLGTGGNTDIAIKMQELADFTLKGVRVDATKVTQAAFQGVNQAVKIAAAAYGVPVKTGSGAAKDGESKDTNGTDLSAADAAVRAANAKLRSKREAARSILRVVAQQQALATATGDAAKAQREQAIQLIKDAIEADGGAATE